MTRSQLAACVKDYRKAFADWAVEQQVVLVRKHGPIEQHITFETLRAGTYRPSGGVGVLIAGGTRILTQFLDIKHREISPQAHAAKWPEVVKAMEEQFRPSVRGPLQVDEVLLLEEEAVERDGIQNVNDFNALAGLHAYQGNLERALHWCNRVDDHLSDKSKNNDPAFDWELEQAQYTRALRAAINLGQQESFLNSFLKH